MPSVYDLKPRFQALLRPLCKALAARGVTANAVTVAAVMLSLLGGALILAAPTARWPLLLVPVVLLARMALNAIDGMLAREHDMKSRLGAYLNELGDVVSDAALYLPFAVVPGISPSLAIAAATMALLTEIAGVLGPMVGAQRRYDGPMGKSDRAAIYGAIALVLGLGAPPAWWSDIVFAIIIAMGALTIVNRVRGGLAAPSA